MAAPLNRRIWFRLAWRHFRSARVVLVIMLLAMLLGQWLHESYLEHFEAVAGLLIVPELVSACFAIVVFILAFTSDRRQRTDSRLAAMGPTAGSLLIPTYAVAAAGAVVICATGFGHALVVIDRDQLIWPETWAELGVIASMPMVLIPATMVFLLSGLVTRNPLKAIALGGIALPVVGLGISEFAVYLAGDQPPEYIEYSIAAIGPLIVLLYVSVVLTRRWCRALPRGQETNEVVPTRIARGLPSLGLFSATMEKTARSPLPRGLRQMLALTWKETRRLPWFLVITAVYITWAIHSEFSNDALGGSLLVFVTFCGTMTFQHEQYDDLVRFYAERGVSRRVFIGSRLAFWGTLAFTMLVAYGIYIFAADGAPIEWSSIKIGDEEQKTILTVATAVQILFLMGVWASIAARTRLVAWTMSCVLVCGLLMLGWLIDALGTRLLSLLPILIGLVLGIWLRLSPWMNSRRRFRDYLPSRLVFVFGLLAAWFIPMAGMMSKMPIVAPVPLLDRLPGDRELLLPGRPSPTDPIAFEPSDPALKAVFQGIESDFYTVDLSRFRYAPHSPDGRGSLLQRYSHLHQKHRQHLHAAMLAVNTHAPIDVDTGLPPLLLLETCYLESIGKPSQAIKVLEAAATVADDCYPVDGGYELAIAHELWVADIAVSHQPLSPDLLAQARDAIHSLREQDHWQPASHDIDLDYYNEYEDRTFKDTMVHWLGMGMLRRRAVAHLNSVRVVQLANLRSALRQGGSVRKALREAEIASELAPPLPFLLGALSNDLSQVGCDVSRVLSARRAMAVLDIAQHVLDHGRFPTSVEQVNPWTGRPFILQSVTTGIEAGENGQRKVCLFRESQPKYDAESADYEFPQAMVDALYESEPK